MTALSTSALAKATPIAEMHGVGREQFEAALLPAARPVVLRGLVADWPAARLGRESAEAICRYLIGLDNGTPVDALMLAPQEKGRIFYNAAFDGFNFLKNKLPLTRIIEQVARYSQFDEAPAVAAQSALIAACLPGFLDAHRLPLLEPAIEPRIWLGTAITVPAHCDETDNIACVVAGKRRFTLFPPEAFGDLYLGPLENTPAGRAVSMVDFSNPDFNRFPRFGRALEQAQVAELGPGDALFIPSQWFHHVVGLDNFNVLVNYWWRDTPRFLGDPELALLHAILAVRDLPDDVRHRWKALFDHYVFTAGTASTAHLPEGTRGILDPLNSESAGRLRAYLLRSLSK